MYYYNTETIPPLLVSVLEKRGWKPSNEPNKWNLWWKGSRFRKNDVLECKSWQKLNHYPKTAIITRKDSLFRCLRTMKCIYGSIYDYYPQTFVLPCEFKKFIRVYAQEEQCQKPKTIWICKPTDMSRGRGIFVFDDLKYLNYDCK
jgi:tubulin polyglutamylase TTLL2